MNVSNKWITTVAAATQRTREQPKGDAALRALIAGLTKTMSCVHCVPLPPVRPWYLRVETRLGLETPIKTFWTLACFGSLAFVLDIINGLRLTVWTVRP